MTRFAVFLLGLTLAGCSYARIQQLEERVRVARSEIELQLQRRADLVPNLIETIQERGSLDPDLVETLADSRMIIAGAVRSGDVSEMERGSRLLGDAVGRLLERARAANLRSDPGFGILRDQLQATDSAISVARREYNMAVEAYNSFIEDFPALVTARVVGARRFEYFRPGE